MSLKKILILPVGFLLINVIYTACFCNCPDVDQHYYILKDATVKPSGPGGAVIDNGSVTTVDTVFLNTSFNFNCTAKQTPDFSFLVNSAYACSCASCGDRGLKSNLASFIVVSDNDYNGIPAGQPLNSLLRVRPSSYSNNSYLLDSLISQIKKDNYVSYTYALFTKIKPGNNSGHKFTVTLKFADSSVVTGSTTNPVIWQ